MSKATEWELAKEISDLRFNKKIESAIERCEFAIKEYPNNNLFYKLLGDLSIQNGNWKVAKTAYINQLKCLGNNTEYFKHFVRFYYRFQKCVPDSEFKAFKSELINLKNAGVLSENIQKELVSSIFPELSSHKNLIYLIDKNNNDDCLDKIRLEMDKINDESEIGTLINYLIQSRKDSNKNTYIYFASYAEKHKKYKEALELLLITNNKNDKMNPTIVRAIFRICRMKHDYSEAETTFKIDGAFISNSDFNIQYELVYYFEYKDDQNALNSVLKRMRGSASGSAPIAKTLYNFYLKFNKFDEANELSEHINELEKKQKRNENNNDVIESRIDAQNESEFELRIKMQELVSEQEHNRQMIAIRELLKGFSHELGQPITNIRYAIQLYNLKVEKGRNEKEDIPILLDKIIKQTDRVGTLLQRFRPIVSSKSSKTEFGLLDNITQVFNNLSDRLYEANIITSIEGEPDVTLYGDSLQFEQVFYNLFLNSIQAIKESKKNEGKIFITISSNAKNIRILFEDNGPGIPNENIHKIFTPFFSTKDPAVFQDGGEGLGLYIVWNILKIFNGTIRVDTKYNEGAKFIININKKENDKNE